MFIGIHHIFILQKFFQFHFIFQLPFSDNKSLCFENNFPFQEYGYGLWALEKKRTGEVIGECGLTNQLVKGKSYPEIGYHLCGKEWHKGYAIEAAAATKQYAFDVLNFPEVISTIRDTNLASMNVAIRNQMLVRDRYIKTYRGKTMPHYIFSVKNQKNKD